MDRFQDEAISENRLRPLQVPVIRAWSPEQMSEPLHLQVFRECRLMQANILSGETAAAVHDILDRMAVGDLLQDVPGPVLALAIAFATYPEARAIIANKALAFHKKISAALNADRRDHAKDADHGE